MAEKTLIAKVSRDDADPDALVVTSPVVGLAEGLVRAGSYLNPLDKILTLRILNQRHVLRLPRDVQGRVAELYVPDALTPVAYGDRLLRLSARTPESGTRGGSPGGAGTAGGVATVGADGTNIPVDAAQAALTVTSPTVGIFYRRPSPDADSYVEVGSGVTTGSVLGLVEVMKCFNQITYGGLDLPERGTVTRILADDGQEVEFGQPLFEISAG